MENESGASGATAFSGNTNENAANDNKKKEKSGPIRKMVLYISQLY